MDNIFIIVVPFYNVEKYIAKTIKSVLAQDYKNYGCILVNDKSTDNSLEICENLVGDNPHFKIINNETKKCSLENIYNAIHGYTPNNSVIVILDGDDFLFGKDVLTHLNETYKKENCLLTYGSYVNLSNKRKGKFAKQIPDYVIKNNDFRKHEWCTSHLRSFKASLFKKIKKKDLCDENGFYTITGDLAIMFPMLEMAGERSKYIDKILYIWNDLNVLNDHKKDNAKQIMVERILRGGKKYVRLD